MTKIVTINVTIENRSEIWPSFYRQAKSLQTKWSMSLFGLIRTRLLILTWRTARWVIWRLTWRIVFARWPASLGLATLLGRTAFVLGSRLFLAQVPSVISQTYSTAKDDIKRLQKKQTTRFRRGIIDWNARTKNFLCNWHTERRTNEWTTGRLLLGCYVWPKRETASDDGYQRKRRRSVWVIDLHFSAITSRMRLR